MPRFIRTARPSGDIRSLPWVVEASSGNVPATGVVSGEIVMVNDTIGVCFQTAIVGVTVGVVYHCEKLMLQKAAVAMLVGQKLYHSGVYGTTVTTVYASGLYWIGIVVEDADAGASLVKADLKGDKASLTEPL